MCCAPFCYALNCGMAMFWGLKETYFAHSITGRCHPCTQGHQVASALTDGALKWSFGEAVVQTLENGCLDYFEGLQSGSWSETKFSRAQRTNCTLQNTVLDDNFSE